jgi:hypothetical protein
MRSFVVSFLVLGCASALVAQTPTVHLINTPTASSKHVLGSATAVRQLPTGRLLVNDAGKRQLLMFDPTLATATVIADSVSGGANSYGPSAGGLIAYAADSSLFIDPRDLTMFVIDPAGVITRVAAVPRSQDANVLGTNTNGTPGFDSNGRLVYRAGLTMMMPKFVNGALSMPDMPDSTALVRVDLATRKIDTAGFFKISKTKMTMSQSEKGMSITTEINPMPIVDDWAVLSDGTIAVVRGRDYHVDFIGADGKVTAAAKLPFDWQRLSDDDKIAVIDSARAAVEKSRAAAAAGATTPAAPGDGGRQIVVMNSFHVGGDGGSGADTKAAGAAGMQMPPINFVSPSELPDYRPAFGLGAAKADRDGNLWIRTTAVRAGAMSGPIYDVVNGRGELADRVQLPAGRQIVGFGKNGTIYMVARDETGAWLEQTHRAGITP